MPDHPNTPGPWADGFILSDSESDGHSKRQSKDHPNTPGPWADGYVLSSQHKDHSHTPGPWADGYVLPTASQPQPLPDIGDPSAKPPHLVPGEMTTSGLNSATSGIPFGPPTLADTQMQELRREVIVARDHPLEAESLLGVVVAVTEGPLGVVKAGVEKFGEMLEDSMGHPVVNSDSKAEASVDPVAAMDAGAAMDARVAEDSGISVDPGPSGEPDFGGQQPNSSPTAGESYSSDPHHPSPDLGGQQQSSSPTAGESYSSDPHHPSPDLGGPQQSSTTAPDDPSQSHHSNPHCDMSQQIPHVISLQPEDHGQSDHHNHFHDICQQTPTPDTIP